MLNMMDSAIDSTCNFFNDEYNSFLPINYDAKRCLFLLSKLFPVFSKYPQFFENKDILDFGSGQGEHTYLLSHFANKVYSYDLSRVNMLRQFKMFYDRENIKILRSENECSGKFDTFIAISLLHLIEDQVKWISELKKNIVAEKYIFISSYHEEVDIEDTRTDNYENFFSRQTKPFKYPSFDDLHDTFSTHGPVERFDFKDNLGVSRVALILN